MTDVTTSVQIVLTQHCNGTASNRLFGGQIMAWIDIVGAVAARMEVRIDSFVEQMDGYRKLVNRAYAVYVALDENDKPVAVKPFIPQTAAEKEEYRAALERKAARTHWKQ